MADFHSWLKLQHDGAKAEWTALSAAFTEANMDDKPTGKVIDQAHAIGAKMRALGMVLAEYEKMADIDGHSKR